jgi:hypothetical protein
MPSGQIDTPAFKQWFGNSKVVDESGKPRVVYHGTDVDFTRFDTTDFGSWFAQSPKTAEQYTEKTGEGAARTVPAFLRVEKPFVIPDKIDLSQDTTVRSFLRAVNSANGTKLTVQDVNLGNFNLTEPRPAFEFVSFNDGFFEAVRALGFDGIKANELGEPTWNVFEAEQIKSSTGNKGTFSRTSADIRLMPDPSIPGAYSMSGFRVLPGKTKGRVRVYSPTGGLLGIVSSNDEAQRMIQRKLR